MKERELVVKNVDMLGDTVLAAQDSEGNIWAGVRWFCNGLGLSRGQINNENNRIQTDLALRRGCTKFNAGVFDPNNETVALKLDFVPLWLAKISITPSMEQSNPNLADKLIEYQLKAKDILADAFLNKKDTPPTSTSGQIHLLAQGYTELEEKVDTVERKVDYLEDTMNIDYAQQKQLRSLAGDVVVNAIGDRKNKSDGELVETYGRDPRVQK